MAAHGKRQRQSPALAVLAVLAVVGAAAWAAAGITNRTYPDHLLRRPRLALKALLGEEILLRDYAPRSHLVVSSHEVRQAKFPAINIHAHFNWKPLPDSSQRVTRTPEDLLELMDACNLQVLVNLDGKLGDDLRDAVARYSQPHPDRFITFATFGFPKTAIQWETFRQQVEQLAEAKAAGAKGVKIWKNIGLRTRDEHGRVIPLDDERLEPLWNQLDALQLPVLIHVADPHANFEPVDRYNERYEWLHTVPDWSYYGKGYPDPDTILQQFERVVARHRQTTFILAHLGNLAERLAEAGAMLDRHPNLSMDISARVQELGRQPETARAFFLAYQDRLVFGTDGNPDPAVYRQHFRFLETHDEYFDYPYWPLFNYGRWKIYGIGLPDEVLRKVYHDNAARILGLPRLKETRP